MSAGTRLFKVCTLQGALERSLIAEHASADQELKEISRASKNDSGIDLNPDENNIYAWKGLLQVGRNHEVGFCSTGPCALARGFDAHPHSNCCRDLLTHHLKAEYLRLC